MKGGEKIVSFCVISWNRPEESVDVVKSIVSLHDVPDWKKELVIVNNGSDKDYAKFETFVEETRKAVDFEIVYDRLAENGGVAAGRNEAIKKATGEILIFIDDDAVFERQDALKLILDKFSDPKNISDNVRAFGFRIENFYTREVKLGEFPHKKYDERIDLPSFKTYYFIGCGHAFERSVIEKTGLYPTDFFYGAEEYDLCFRILDAGYQIKYCGDITVYHKVSPEGRKPPKFLITRLTENRMLVAYTYLPWRYVFSQLLFWKLHLLRETNFDVVNLFKMFRSLLVRIKQRKRKPLNQETMKYLKEVEARLIY